MNSENEEGPSRKWGVSREEAEPDLEMHVPLSVRNARQMRQDLWPSI